MTHGFSHTRTIAGYNCESYVLRLFALYVGVKFYICKRAWLSISLSEQGRIQTVAPVARATVRFPNLNFWKIMGCSKYPDMVLAV